MVSLIIAIQTCASLFNLKWTAIRSASNYVQEMKRQGGMSTKIMLVDFDVVL